MSMNEQEQRIFIRFLATRLKKYYRELSVHRALAQTLRDQGYRDVDAILDTFRTEPVLAEEMDRRFAWFDKLLPPNEAGTQESDLREYLEKWQPDGEPN